jgi:hypothetical protein
MTLKRLAITCGSRLKSLLVPSEVSVGPMNPILNLTLFTNQLSQVIGSNMPGPNQTLANFFCNSSPGLLQNVF